MGVKIANFFMQGLAQMLDGLMHPRQLYNLCRDIAIINNSFLFDSKYYKACCENVDLAAFSPLLHYCRKGWKEGRNPSTLFKSSDYLMAYPDVAESGMNPLAHYIKFGISEGRFRFTVDVESENKRVFCQPSQYTLGRLGKLAGIAKTLTTQFVKCLILYSAARKKFALYSAHRGLLRFLQTESTLCFPTVCPGAQARISIIIVLYNKAGLTLKCLRSLSASQGIQFEIIVVDNASSDETQALMSRVYGVRYFRNEQNEHFLKAVNQAADYATGEYLLLLNNDTEVMPDALERAVCRIESSSNIGAVGGKIVLLDGSLQEAGSIIWQDASCLGYGRGEDPEAPPFQFMRAVDYCSGAFLLTRRSLFESLGRFDTRFAPAYYEETDYCVRLLEAGYEIIYDPTVCIRHFEFASSTNSDSALALQRQNHGKFLDKHKRFLSHQAVPSSANILLARQRLPAGHLRILIIDDRVPHCHLGSGYPRANLIIHLLAEQGHAVTFYPLQSHDEKWTHVYKSLPRTVEVMLAYGQARLGKFLAERRGYYDRIIVSRPHNMQILQNHLEAMPDLLGVDESPALRIIYDAEAVFSLREQLEAALKGRPIPEEVAATKLKAELSLAQRAQTIFAVSETEAAHFRAIGDAQVFVLGHSLASRPTSTPFSRRSCFLFVGAMHGDASPNADSMRWFIQQIWPLIRAKLGAQARLDIVGLCQAESVRALAGNGVHIHGIADSLDSYYERARVFVAPTRFASGIPHKAHEAASHGVPMVVTSLIAGQLGWGEAVLCADDPGAFAEHCVKLFSEESIWTDLRALGLAHVEHDCSPERFRATLCEVIGTDLATVG